MDLIYISSATDHIRWRDSKVARYVLALVEIERSLSPSLGGSAMDIEENDIKGLGVEAPYTAQRSARDRHDEDSISYIKPIIKELVRTQVCFPNIKLLVDRISTLKVPSATESPGLEAYRMYLTDREKTIQGLQICYICFIKFLLIFRTNQLS